MTGWRFEDYPIETWKNPNAGSPSVAYGAKITNWSLMVGHGETPEVAIEDLRRRFDLRVARGMDLPEPGASVPIKYSQTLLDEIAAESAGSAPDRRTSDARATAFTPGAYSRPWLYRLWNWSQRLLFIFGVLAIIVILARDRIGLELAANLVIFLASGFVASYATGFVASFLFRCDACGEFLCSPLKYLIFERLPKNVRRSRVSCANCGCRFTY